MLIRVVVVDPRPLVREAITRLLEGDGGFLVGVPVSALEELVQQAIDPNQLVAVVGAPAMRECEEQFVREVTRLSKSFHILVLADDPSDDAICRLLLLGCRGCLAEDASGATLKKAIEAVARGQIWAERRLVARSLQQALAAADTDHLLTGREREILGLLRAGRSNHQIAEALYISPDTVKWHLRRVFAKIGAKDRLEATLWARANNVFPRLERLDRPVVAPRLPDRRS